MKTILDFESRSHCDLRKCGVYVYGIAVDTARELILAHYNDRCKPPWSMSNPEDAEHFEEKLRNAYNYAQNSLGAKTVEAATKAAVQDFAALPMPEPPTTEGWVPKGRPILLSETFPDDDFFLSIGNEGVIERGDVAVLQAKTKSGKSSALTAMMASMFVASDVGRDFIGWRGDNKKGDYVLHFDTEQKPKDSQSLLKRALATRGANSTSCRNDQAAWPRSSTSRDMSRYFDFDDSKFSTPIRILAEPYIGLGLNFCGCGAGLLTPEERTEVIELNKTNGTYHLLYGLHFQN
jgi:hypothetical protein